MIIFFILFLLVLFYYLVLDSFLEDFVNNGSVFGRKRFRVKKLGES